MLEKNNMGFISLTSDLGTQDGSVAKIKTKIISNNHQHYIIDISHDINPFDLLQTAYVINNSYQSFPNHSVHIILVDALQHPIQKALAARINDHFFLANDNGIFSLLKSPNDAIEVRLLEGQENPRFDMFCQTAVQLAENPEKFNQWELFSKPKELTSMKPMVKENSIVGSIIYVDNYGNAISNITKSLFEEERQNRNFDIFARNYSFNQLLENYSDVVANFDNEMSYHGRNMALFNDNGFLEFAMYKSNHNSVGGASQLLGLQIGEKVRIQFI